MALQRRFQRKQTLLLITMSNHSERLQLIVSELLSRVDDLDAECKYRQLTLSSEHSRRLEAVCSELVLLGDVIRLLDKQIDARSDKRAQKQLKRSLDSAAKVSDELSSLRQDILNA